jgi:hypothetical protein
VQPFSRLGSESRQAAEISALKQAPPVAPPPVLAAGPPVAIVETTGSKPRPMDPSTVALIEKAKARMAKRTTNPTPGVPLAAGVSSSDSDDDDSSYMSDDSSSCDESALTSGFFSEEN